MAKNGGFRGFRNSSSLSTANGLWGIPQVSEGLKNIKWPELIPFEYLLIAGGGGGGGADNEIEGGGGGGAGGLRAGILNTFVGYGVTVTVGSGGPGAPTHPNTPQYGSMGGESVFDILTSTGGGSGGRARDGFSTVMDGGSGGGGAGRSSRQGYGNTPPTDPPQGYDGRVPSEYANDDAGGGGGSSGTFVGLPIWSPGPGTTSSLSGSEVTYALGGQGGRGINQSGYVAGGANTGTGGAGGYGRNSPAGGDQTCQGGRAGGSGIVIVRYPNKYPDLTVSEGLAFTSNNQAEGYKTYVFTSGSGTISIV